jgi:hypothetical protein
VYHTLLNEKTNNKAEEMGKSVEMESQDEKMIATVINQHRTAEYPVYFSLHGVGVCLRFHGGD